MNSYCKFHDDIFTSFKVTLKKPEGGAEINPPPGVRGLKERF